MQKGASNWLTATCAIFRDPAKLGRQHPPRLSRKRTPLRVSFPPCGRSLLEPLLIRIVIPGMHPLTTDQLAYVHESYMREALKDLKWVWDGKKVVLQNQTPKQTQTPVKQTSGTKNTN